MGEGARGDGPGAAAGCADGTAVQEVLQEHLGVRQHTSLPHPTSPSSRVSWCPRLVLP